MYLSYTHPDDGKNKSSVMKGICNLIKIYILRLYGRDALIPVISGLDPG